MSEVLRALRPDENPLRSEDPRVWDALIEAIGPPGILLVIESRMSEELRAQVSADDVWQETLLHVWRERARCEWRGVPAFRQWVLRIADHRIHDPVDAGSAEKRGGKASHVPLQDVRVRTGGTTYAGPVGTTTPRRAAMDRERAELMKTALASLPADIREVVRLGLFDDLSMEETARRLGIHPQAARRRFRKGCEEYYRRIKSALSTPPQGRNGRQGTAPIPL
jgi:RNA polymerase sigma factor (sigma-70 family)